jgi:thiosulfate reductase cytochrome b subunit
MHITFTALDSETGRCSGCFPRWFYNDFHFKYQLAQGLAYHFFFMWFFALNGIAYVLYTFLSGEWRNLIPTRHSFAGAFHVVLHDLGLSKRPLPRQKFNDAQRIAYTSVVLMGIGSLLTGLAIYKPTVTRYSNPGICSAGQFSGI